MTIDTVLFVVIPIASIFWATGCSGSGAKKKKKAENEFSTETARPGKVGKSKMSRMAPQVPKAVKPESNESIRKEVVESESGSELKREESNTEVEKRSELKPMKQSEQQRLEDGKPMEKKESVIMKKSSVMKMEDEVSEGERKEEVKKEATRKVEVQEKKEEKKEEVKRDEDIPMPVDLRPHIVLIPSTDLQFKAIFTNQTKLTIKSVHDKKVMFKIKLSDNATYQVNPVFGVVDPGKTVDVAVTHKKGPPTQAKLVVLNNVLTGDEKDVANLFKTITKPTGAQVPLKLVAT